MPAVPASYPGGLLPWDFGGLSVPVVFGWLEAVGFEPVGSCGLHGVGSLVVNELVWWLCAVVGLFWGRDGMLG